MRILLRKTGNAANKTGLHGKFCVDILERFGKIDVYRKSNGSF